MIGVQEIKESCVSAGTNAPESAHHKPEAESLDQPVPKILIHFFSSLNQAPFQQR